MKRCKKKTEWGRCSQPAPDYGELCLAHEFWVTHGVTPDRFYEEKVVKGLKEPTWSWMTPAEANAVINGRYKGDGRRIDQWTIDEGPMQIDTEAF